MRLFLLLQIFTTVYHACKSASSAVLAIIHTPPTPRLCCLRPVDGGVMRIAFIPETRALLGLFADFQ